MMMMMTMTMMMIIDHDNARVVRASGKSKLICISSSTTHSHHCQGQLAEIFRVFIITIIFSAWSRIHL